MGNWLLNESPKWILVAAWLAVNIALFVKTYLSYMADKYVYVRTIIGHGLPVARSAAYLLNFNCMLILLPVCRNLISFLRGASDCCTRVRRQLDRNIIVHRYLAYWVCALSVIHTGAHCFNLEHFVQAYDSSNPLIQALSGLPDGPNPVHDRNTDAIKELFKLIPGVTGIVLVLSLVLMVSSSTNFIRRSYFEVFWFTHHLFVIFYIALVIHGIQGVVKSQANTDEHDPNVCKEHYDDWGSEECPVPTFTGTPAASWKWVVGPFALYFLERCIRFYRSLQPVRVIKVIKHPSRVVELILKKPGFRAEVGQYVFLHCPSISQLEWHPFTLTSCPEDENISIHIRVVGDWTAALALACGVDNDQQPEKLPRLAIDGPFGTASEDVFDYSVVLLIGAGIGVTPFASVLKSIWYKYNDERVQLKLAKVYFYWICPDTMSFEWFADLLKSLERQMVSKGMPNFLEYNIYLTRGWDANQARNIVLHEEAVYDVVTNLRHKTHYGRPNWEQIFQNMTAAHGAANIGVFLCGPKSLSTTLRQMCNKQSSVEPSGARFYFNKENF